MLWLRYTSPLGDYSFEYGIPLTERVECLFRDGIRFGDRLEIMEYRHD